MSKSFNNRHLKNRNTVVNSRGKKFSRQQNWGKQVKRLCEERLGLQRADAVEVAQDSKVFLR